MIKTISGIYKIENIVSGRMYIGQTIDLHKRKMTHRWSLEGNRHFNNYLQYAYNKYGGNAFTIETICECPIEELDDKEIYYIKLYNSANFKIGYNLMDGGQGIRIFSEELRLKLGNARRGIKLTPEHRANIGKGNKGRIVSNETKERNKKTRELRRTSQGGDNSQALISDNTAIEIIKLLMNDIPVLEIIQKYNIPRSVVYNIRAARSYTDLMPGVREEVKNRFTDNYNAIINKAVDMYNMGISQNKLSQLLKISRNTLSRELKTRGIDTQKYANQFIKL